MIEKVEFIMSMFDNNDIGVYVGFSLYEIRYTVVKDNNHIDYPLKNLLPKKNEK